MTTAHTPAALPFLVPAANLAVGDTLKDGKVIDAVETAPGGKIHVTFTDGRWPPPFLPGFLVEVTSRRPGARLDKAVAELTALADEWVLGAAGLRGEAHELGESDPDARRLFNRADERHECAEALRALLGRLA